MRLPKLTQDQTKPLVELVDHQTQHGKPVLFRVSHDRAHTSSEVKGAGGKTAVQACVELVELWAASGYVYLRQFDTGLSFKQYAVSSHTWSFLLTQKALDYCQRLRKPRYMRAIFNAWDDLRPDLRSALVAAVFSILVSTATTVLLLSLGLPV